MDNVLVLHIVKLLTEIILRRHLNQKSSEALLRSDVVATLSDLH